jgi:hypothetical protein
LIYFLQNACKYKSVSAPSKCKCNLCYLLACYLDNKVFFSICRQKYTKFLRTNELKIKYHMPIPNSVIIFFSIINILDKMHRISILQLESWFSLLLLVVL